MKIKFFFSCNFCTVLFLTASGITLFSQPHPRNEKAELALTFIYRSHYDSARRVLNTLDNKQDALVKSILEVFAMRWEYIPIVSSTQKNSYLKKLTETADLLKKVGKQGSDHLYLHITSELLLAEYYYTNSDAGQALWHGKKVYPLLMKTFDENKNEPEFIFVKGLYLYYMDFFRAKGFMYRTVLFPFRDGDQKQGLRLLEEAAAAQSLAKTESLIYLAHIYLHLENEPFKALPYSRKLVELYPSNTKFQELLLDNLMSAALYKEAMPLLEKQLAIQNAYYRIPALYFAGCAAQDFEKNKTKATTLFEKCVTLSKDTGLSEAYAEKAKEKLKQNQ